jgi:Contractile injection system tape measure protein
MRHLIKKQELRLTVGPGLEPFGVQHAASRYYRNILLPILERIFDELSVEEEVIRIDRLMIDIGRIAETSLQSGLANGELYALIRKEVLQVVQGNQPDAGVSHAPLLVNVLDQWWYYMEKGRLPWNAEGITSEWYRQVLEILSVDFSSITRLRKALSTGGTFLQRITYQHPDEFLETLTGILTGVRQPSLIGKIEDFCFLGEWLASEYRRAISAIPEERGPLRDEKEAALIESLHRWATRHRRWLALSREERRATPWGRLIREAAGRPAALQAGAGALLSPWLTEDAALVQWIREKAPGIRALAWAMPEEREVRAGRPENPDSKDIRENQKYEAAGPEPVGKTDGTTSRTQEEEEEGVTSRDSGSKRQADQEDPETQDGLEELVARDGLEVDEEGLYGRHAGLVLLHPFLATLFTRLQWWDGGGFTSLPARQQAVLLLHYLATGEKKAPEYELVFPKLLCGFRLEAPLPGKMDLPEEAFEEAETLLQNVLIRWDKLKNTSADGLREGFLQRTGKLVKRNGRSILLLEINAIDVLLDYLPWNLSLVKLPWLKELLYVEWR